MNTWRNDGSASAACCPIMALSIGHVAPAEHLQALAGGDLLDAGASGGLRLGVAGQEPDAGGVGAGRRERRSRPPPGGSASGTWMRIPAPSPTFTSALVAPRWSRLHSELQAELHHAVRGAAVQVGDEGHAARVVLEARVVEALLGGQHQLSIPGSGGSEEQVQSSAVGRRWPAAGSPDCSGHRSRGASHYDRSDRLEGAWTIEVQVRATDAIAGERGLRRRPRAAPPGRGGRGPHPGRRRPLPAPAGAGGRAARRQGPPAARPWPRSAPPTLSPVVVDLDASAPARRRTSTRRVGARRRRPPSADRRAAPRARSELDSILATAVSNAIHRALPSDR